MKALQRGLRVDFSETLRNGGACSSMEQFIGDAHKNFSVFVAVNEKGQASEALAWLMIACCTVSS
jgi:hypothetical protein